MRTDPIQRALELRDSLVQDNKVLVADFSGTLQGKDTSKVIELMPLIGTQCYPFRTKVNVKELDSLASAAYGTDFFDISRKTKEEIESFVKKREFDFPLWYKHEDNFDMKQIQLYNLPFILQVAGCNFHDGSSSGGCRYCFVDNQSNDCKPGSGKAQIDINGTIESMLSAREKIKKQYNDIGYDIDLRVLRISGGEPTIALDWILNLWRKVGRKGLDFVGQLDSNLSTARVVEGFEHQGVFERNTLEKLAEYPIKILTAIKGVDEENLQSNVQSKTTLEDQLYSLKKFISAGFDIYPQMYNPNPTTLMPYLEKKDSVIENFALKVHIGPIKIYKPTLERLSLEAQKRGIDAIEFINQTTSKWNSNYEQSCEIIDKYLRERYNVGYKETTRADIKLRLK